MSNKKIVLASITVIVAAGLLALSPLMMIGNAQAQMYADRYGYDSNYYQDDRYGYDNHPKKSSDVNSQKIKCLNGNVNQGGTLRLPTVVELEDYLANPANTVPIGADPDVNTIGELYDAIEAADGTDDQVEEDDIRGLLGVALKNPPPGQVLQVINCLLGLGLITED